jgi:hypothetical protein
MVTDAGPSTRAIRSGPVVETAVYDVFDGVTYIKGGAVLDMLETYVGSDVFRRGVNAYFEGQQLSNATAGDLCFTWRRHPERMSASSPNPGPISQVIRCCRHVRTATAASKVSRWCSADSALTTPWTPQACGRSRLPPPAQRQPPPDSY